MKRWRGWNENSICLHICVTENADTQPAQRKERGERHTSDAGPEPLIIRILNHQASREREREEFRTWNLSPMRPISIRWRHR